MADHSYPILHSAIDLKHRRLWLLRSAFQASALSNPPFPCQYQIISLIDTGSVSFAGYATDTSNHINTSAKGDTGNSLGFTVIDTKYDQAVVGGNQGGWVSWYDLASTDCVDTKSLAFLPGEYQFQRFRTPYDPTRGLIYKANYNLSTLSVTIIDCDPGVHAVTTTHSAPAFQGGESAYYPDTDKVYIANPSGPNMYHIWDPVTKAFTTNQGPLGSASQLRYFPTTGIGGAPGSHGLFAIAAGGQVTFVDPTTNLSVGNASGATLINFEWSAYNSCTGHIYASPASGGTLVKVDPASGFASSLIVPLGNVKGFEYDPSAGRLFVYDDTTHEVTTFA